MPGVVVSPKVRTVPHKGARDLPRAEDVMAKTYPACRYVTDTMRSNLRSFDPVLRYGGDEFVAGVSGVDVDEAARRFETINDSVEREVGVRFSVGFAELEPDQTLERMLAKADARLLAAKREHSR